MPTKLLRMTNGPPEFQRAFNALVDAVEALQKISASAPLELDVTLGIPKFRLRSSAVAELRIGQADSAIAADGSGDVSVWRWDGSSFVDTGENLNARNFFSSTITAGNKVMLAKNHLDGEWYIIAEDCS